jgi:hypothetical protein
VRIFATSSKFQQRSFCGPPNLRQDCTPATLPSDPVCIVCTPKPPHHPHRDQTPTARHISPNCRIPSPLGLSKKMARFHMILAVLGSLIMTATAQFGFFDQMFGGGQQQQQQEPQNVRSDASWYQAQYEAGMASSLFRSLALAFSSLCLSSYLHLHHHRWSLMLFYSPMLTLPLPRHPLLRPLPPPLPLRLGGRRR